MSDNKSNLDVKSSASILNDEKSKESDKELKMMREAAKKDREKAEKKKKEAEAEREHRKKEVEKAHDKAEAERTAALKKRKQAKSSISKKEKKIEKAAMSVGGLLFGTLLDSRKRRSVGGAYWVLIGLVVIAVIVGFVFFKPQIANLLGLTAPTIEIPESVQGLLPDEEMGYNKIDFENVILGEAREKQELVVMEQDVEVESEISSALANISIFKKSKLIRSFGTGVYTVDMKDINSRHIEVDEDKKIVTVTISHAVLQYVNIDNSKTEFEDTEKAILGFGDIKMTQEQQKILSESIDTTMKEKLDDEKLLKKADEIAVLKVREIFQPLISAVSDEFIVKVVQP